MFCFCLSKCGIQTFGPTNNDAIPARLLDADSSSDNSSSSSSEDEHDPENVQDVEMRPPIEYNDPHGLGGNQSPYSLDYHDKRKRFTT